MSAPPFKLTSHVLSQVAEICEQIGRLDGADWGSRSLSSTVLRSGKTTCARCWLDSHDSAGFAKQPYTALRPDLGREGVRSTHVIITSLSNFMSTESEHPDSLPSRADLAKELLLHKMREYSEDFYCAGWPIGLEFELWEAAFGDSSNAHTRKFSETDAKTFRDLASLCQGWWVWPDTMGQKGSTEVFISLDEWQVCLKKRSDTHN